MITAGPTPSRVAWVFLRVVAFIACALLARLALGTTTHPFPTETRIDAR
jgi:hypothetical protein